MGGRIILRYASQSSHCRCLSRSHIGEPWHREGRLCAGRHLRVEPPRHRLGRGRQSTLAFAAHHTGQNQPQAHRPTGRPERGVERDCGGGVQGLRGLAGEFETHFQVLRI
jgi:hypothetical protein